MTATATEPATFTNELHTEVQVFAVAAIAPDPDQPRKDVDEELAESIAAQGVLQPITIRTHPTETGDIRFMIVDGERRWRGAKKAGFKTIPAIFRAGFDDEAERLIRQTVFNTGKPLSPVEEAKSWKRIQELKGLNAQQLAKLLGRSKSTVGDRLALAEAPAAFEELFACGALTAAAAPIIRKYATLPPKMLEKAVAEAAGGWQWHQYIHEGKPIPLDRVESGLKAVLVGEPWSPGPLRALTAAVKPLYKGDTVTIGKTEYATDVQAFIAAEKAYQREQEKLAKATAGAKDEKEKEDKWQRQNRLSQERWQREQAQRRAESARFNKARPKVLAAFADAIRKAPTGISANRKSAVAELVLKECSGQGATKDVLALLPVGSNAESILRHCAFLCIADVSANSYLREHQMPKLAKAFGVDLKKIVDQAAPRKKTAKKAAKKEGKR